MNLKSFGHLNRADNDGKFKHHAESKEDKVEQDHGQT